MLRDEKKRADKELMAKMAAAAEQQKIREQAALHDKFWHRITGKAPKAGVATSSSSGGPMVVTSSPSGDLASMGTFDIDGEELTAKDQAGP